MMTRWKFNRNKLNLFLDMGLALAFVVELQEHFSGLRLHELLGLTFGAALVIHIILHFDWIVSVTRHLFQKVLHESRLNYVLNIAVFIDMLAATVTGILISRTLNLGISLDQQTQGTFHQLHILSSNFALVLIGLHVALHWKWIATHTKKYLFRFNFLNRKPQLNASRTLTNAEAK
jgi:hypothetical protein